MVSDKKRIVPFRRKAAARTDYRLRLRLLRSRKPRLVIRRSNKHLLAQLVNYTPDGDHVITTASTQQLRKLGWNAGCGNTPAAYLLGLLIAKKAKEKKVGDVVVDFGMYVSRKGNKLYAVVKGAQEGKLQITCPESMFPSADRLTGKHIQAFSKDAKEKQFSKTKEAANNISALVDKVKAQLM